ncbi:flavodoxin family protein [Clostridium sp. CF012]|uniref:flavodoxin family protein n=1 Tax=Clostridium sp. CF012 TaxID=2843319 RepID=UPI001C0D7F35|nr:flavodoxin family protein [Clostridium sp. CF012]MBU3146058.1 flavodoxin family protein [Clostridium sp. CF012]
MKIIVLMGSPRKKDSYNVCKLIEAKLMKSSIIELEYIFLKDYVIEDCKGCDMCFKKNESLCPCKDDDLHKIKEKLLNADAIVFASPVYAYQVPAPLKRVIDRLSYLFHRQELIGKPALTVVTSDGGGHKQVSKYLKMTLCGWGCNLVGNINIISPMFFEKKENSAWGYDKSYHKTNTEKIERFAERFIKITTDNAPHTPTFYDIFMFNCLRSKTFTSKADYDFWKKRGWLNSNYFYEVHINLFKRGFGSTLKAIVNLAGKKLKNKSIYSE